MIMICTLLKNKVYYTDEGKGPAIVFLPGPDARPRVWHNQVSELSNSFRVLRLDFSAIDMSSVSISKLVSVIDEFALFKELRQFFIAGCGVGGYLACAYALRHPNMINGVIASSVGFLGTVNDTVRYFIPEYRLTGNRLSYFIDAVLKRKNRSLFLFRYYALLKNNQFLLSEFSSLSAPLLIINGQNEHPLVQKLASDIYYLRGDYPVELEIIEGAASLPNTARFDVYNSFLQEFLKKNIQPL